MIGLLKTYALRGRERVSAGGWTRGLGQSPLRSARSGDRPSAVLRRAARGAAVDEPVWYEDGAVIRAFADPSHHPPPTGTRLVEDERPGQFDPDAARAQGVPEGPLFGQSSARRKRRGRARAAPDLEPEQVVVGPARPGRKRRADRRHRPLRRATIEMARGRVGPVWCMRRPSCTRSASGRTRDPSQPPPKKRAPLRGRSRRSRLLGPDPSLQCVLHLAPHGARPSGGRRGGCRARSTFDQIEVPFAERGQAGAASERWRSIARIGCRRIDNRGLIASATTTFKSVRRGREGARVFQCRNCFAGCPDVRHR